MRRSVLTLLLIALATFFIGLGQQAITDADEAYYAEASREMATSGDWITPHFNFADRWQKPILYYWLTAATYTVAGTSEATARLWSALSGVGLVWLVWWTARRAPETREHAWLAGAITATCFGYFAMARSALPDLPLAFTITLTISAVFGAMDAVPPKDLRWWRLAGAAAGLGLLLKGPVALVVPAVALVPLWWFERKDARVRWQGVVLGGVFALALALPWYLVIVERHGLPYIQSFFVGDNLERFTTTRFNEQRPFWFYAAVIAGGLLPWTAYGLLAAGRALRDAARRQWRPSRGEWRLIAWAILPTLFFAASVGQQPRYVLPVLPPLALLLARALGTRIDRTLTDGRSATLTAGTWATALCFAGAAALLVRLRPLLDSTPPLALTLSLIGIAAGALALAAVAIARAWRWLPATLTAAAVVLLVGVQFSVFSPSRPSAVEEMAALVRAARTGTERVGPYRSFVRNLVFYTGIRQDDLFDQARAVEFFSSRERVLLIAPESDVPRIADAAGVDARILGRVRYFNTATLRLRTLLAPDPAAEFETVVLVTNR